MSGTDEAPVLDSVEEGRLLAVARDFPPINGVRDALSRLLEIARTGRPCDHDSGCSECRDLEDEAAQSKCDARNAIEKAEEELATLADDGTIPSTAQDKIKAVTEALVDARRWL